MNEKKNKQSKIRIFFKDTRTNTKQRHMEHIFMEPFQMNDDYYHTQMSLEFIYTYRSLVSSR